MDYFFGTFGFRRGSGARVDGRVAGAELGCVRVLDDEEDRGGEDEEVGEEDHVHAG